MFPVNKPRKEKNKRPTTRIKLRFGKNPTTKPLPSSLKELFDTAGNLSEPPSRYNTRKANLKKQTTKRKEKDVISSNQLKALNTPVNGNVMDFFDLSTQNKESTGGEPGIVTSMFRAVKKIGNRKSKGSNNVIKDANIVKLIPNDNVSRAKNKVVGENNYFSLESEFNAETRHLRKTVVKKPQYEEQLKNIPENISSDSDVSIEDEDESIDLENSSEGEIFNLLLDADDLDKQTRGSRISSAELAREFYLKTTVMEEKRTAKTGSKDKEMLSSHDEAITYWTDDVFFSDKEEMTDDEATNTFGIDTSFVKNKKELSKRVKKPMKYRRRKGKKAVKVVNQKQSKRDEVHQREQIQKLSEFKEKVPSKSNVRAGRESLETDFTLATKSTIPIRGNTTVLTFGLRKLLTEQRERYQTARMTGSTYKLRGDSMVQLSDKRARETKLSSLEDIDEEKAEEEMNQMKSKIPEGRKLPTRNEEQETNLNLTERGTVNRTKAGRETMKSSFASKGTFHIRGNTTLVTFGIRKLLTEERERDRTGSSVRIRGATDILDSEEVNPEEMI